MNNFIIHKLKNCGMERKGFRLFRQNGSGDYLFLHFKSHVDFFLHDEEFIVKPGTCFIFTPYCSYEFRATNEPLIHDWIHFIPNDLSIFDYLKLPLDTPFYPHNTDFITDMVKSVELEFLNKQLLWDMQIDGQLLCLFSLLGRELTFTKDNSSLYLYESRSKFEALRLNIYDDPARERSVESMAMEAEYSRSRFSVLYKKLFNVSPVEDIINARIQRAKYLLTITDMPISRICENTGYLAIEHFIRQFHKNTGKTPSEFRREAQSL